MGISIYIVNGQEDLVVLLPLEKDSMTILPFK